MPTFSSSFDALNNDTGDDLRITINNDTDEHPFVAIEIEVFGGDSVMEIIVEKAEDLIAFQKATNEAVEQALADIRSQASRS